MNTTTFDGTRLRDARKQKGLSQSRLAQKIGAHVTSVSDWERGDNAPSGRHVASLTRELGVPVNEFFGAEEDDEESDVAAVLLRALENFVRARSKSKAVA